MEHEVIPPGERHAPHNWVVADAAARLALVVAEADLGKYCWQRDNESQWFLSAHDPATWQPMETTVAWDDIADKPDLIEEGDSRITDSRMPTGGAGGVLSGSFPNPGFAADMATQGEMDTQVTMLYTALDDLDAAKIDATEKGAANGVATLGADQKIPESQLPSVAITDVFAVASQAAMLALTAERGDIAVRSDLNKTFALAALPASTLDNWLELRTPTDAVLSVAGRTGAIALAKADVGLGNVDNTSDANKPVSTAQAAALTAHTGQSTGAHAASAVSNTPAGNISATTVQAAINELDAEKAAIAIVREKLTAECTYYVRTDGSDSNTDLVGSAGGAFLTVQMAIDVASAFDLNGFTVSIQLGDGTYTGNIVGKAYVGQGLISIDGNATTPSNTVVSTAPTSFNMTNCGSYRIRNLKVQASAGYAIYAYGARTSLTLAGMVCGTMGAVGVHIFVTAQASVVQNSNRYSIVGGAYSHIFVSEGGALGSSLCTVTLTGTPAFTFYAFAENLSLCRLVSNTYSGSATGSRYSVTGGSAIFTAGAGATALPGNAAGSEATGGRYL